MEKLEQIKKQIQEYQNKSAVTQDLKAFLTLVLGYIKVAKEDFSSISKDNLANLQETLRYLETEHENILSNVKRETTETKEQFIESVKEIKDLIAKVKTLKPIDGVDGITPVKGEDYFTESDIKEITEKVLKEIPEDEEETGEDIVKKINELEITPEKQIDAKHIKNLPESVVYRGGGVSGVKEIIAGTNVTVDNSNPGYPVVSSTGGGSGAVDSVNGQTGVVVLDTDDISDTATNRYTNDTDITRLANTSGTNTGDQDLSGLVPYTGATADLNLGTFDILTDTAKASTSAGLAIQSNSGTVTALFGAGGGANSTFYGGSKFDYATATTVPYFDASKNLISSAVTPTELGYLSGVTSAIQTQLNAKQALDAQLTSLAGLSYSGNAGKFIRVNAGETDFELATISGTGTVTSVAMSVPTGLTVTGSPVTTTGTLAVALDTGYVIPLQTTLDGYVKTDQTVGQTIGTTGARLTKLWATDITVTNAIAGSVTGNAATVTNGVYTTGADTVYLTPGTAASTYQPLDSDLTTIAGLTATTDNFIVSVASAWASRTPAQVRTTLGLVIGTDVQAYDADLTTWAGITPGTGVGTALATNVGSAGAFITFNGDAGTPSALVGTNISGTASGLSIGGNATTSTTATGTNALYSATTTVNVSSATAPTSGQVLTATSATAATWQTPSSGGLTWSEVTGTTQSASVNTGYIANNAALVTITLPTTASVGDVVRVAGKGAGGWKIAQNASEIIHFGNTDTTTGTGGYLASTNTYDAVELLCIVADTEWVVLSTQGNVGIL